MLIPWLTGARAEQAGAAVNLARWSETAGLDLVGLGTTATADEIKDTAVTQPLVVATSILVFHQLVAALESAGLGAAGTGLPADTVVAGHSVGELAAAAVAGALDEATAIEIAAVRGREMAAACALAATGMSAVLGGRPDVVLDRLAELGLDPANRNGAGQIVAAGELAALAELASAPPERARITPLKVAGAFHTRFMAPAEEALRGWIDDRAGKLEFRDPGLRLLSNADGSAVGDGGELRTRLIAQVTRPVRWDQCLVSLSELGVGACVELAPAGALTGLVKRELKGTRTIAVKSPDDLDIVVELLREVTT